MIPSRVDSFFGRLESAIIGIGTTPEGTGRRGILGVEAEADSPTVPNGRSKGSCGRIKAG